MLHHPVIVRQHRDGRFQSKRPWAWESPDHAKPSEAFFTAATVVGWSEVSSHHRGTLALETKGVRAARVTWTPIVTWSSWSAQRRYLVLAIAECLCPLAPEPREVDSENRRAALKICSRCGGWSTAEGYLAALRILVWSCVHIHSDTACAHSGATRSSASVTGTVQAHLKPTRAFAL